MLTSEYLVFQFQVSRSKVNLLTMAHLLVNLKDYFEFDEINIDSWTFKLYYRFSCALCMMGATVGVASQYFGNPIRYLF